MKLAWAKRIQKLESIMQTRVQSRAVFLYGPLRRLPSPYAGEGCIVIVKREPTGLPNVEQCEFEEQIGPAPLEDERSFRVYLNLEDEHDKEDGVP